MNLLTRFNLIFLLSIVSPIMGMEKKTVNDLIKESLTRINNINDPRARGFKAVLEDNGRRELHSLLSRSGTPSEELNRLADESPYAEQLLLLIQTYASSDVIKIFSDLKASGIQKPIAQRK